MRNTERPINRAQIPEIKKAGDRDRTGDLVFYPAGYAMFYFADPREGPFVLGMTPFGITALKSDFAKPVGYRQVQWR